MERARRSTRSSRRSRPIRAWSPPTSSGCARSSRTPNPRSTRSWRRKTRRCEQQAAAVPGRCWPTTSAGGRRTGRGRGAARRHDMHGVPPVDPVDRSGAHPAGRRRGGRVLRQLRRDPRPVTQASLPFAETTDRAGRRADPVLRRRIARQSRPGRDRRRGVRRDDGSARAAGDRERAHRDDDQQRRRVPRADRGPGGGRAFPRTRSSMCARIRCS